VRDRDDREHARDPVDRPRRLVLVSRLLPPGHEGRDGTDERHDRTRYDAEHRTAEHLPQHDAENSAAKTELVEATPTGSTAVPEREDNYSGCASSCTDDLVVQGARREHTHASDNIERYPDEP